MALTITQQPPELALAGNPMKFSVQSDAYIDDHGSPSIYSVLTDKTWDNGTINFEFDYGRFFVNFGTTDAQTLWDSPITEWNTLPGSTNLSGKTWMETIRDFLQRIPWIDKYWVISLNGVADSGRIIFTSRENLPRTVEAGGLVAIGMPKMQMDIPGNQIQGVADTINPFLSLNVKIYVEESYFANDFGLLKEIQLRYLSGDTLDVDISPYLSAYLRKKSLKNHILSPNPTTGPEVVHETNKRYFVKFTETSETDLNHNETISCSIKKAMKGGVKKSEYLVLGDIASLFSVKPLLHWFNPTGGAVSPSSAKKMYFINPSPETKSIVMEYNVVYEDGSAITVSLGGHQITGHSIFSWKIVHPDSPNNYTFDTNNVASIELGIRIDTLGLDIPYNIKFNCEPDQPNQRCIFYENSFGVFESLTVTARAAYGAENEKEEVDMPLDSVTGDYETIAFNKGFTEVYEASTGPLSARQSIALIDMLNSDNVYLKTGDDLLRINIKEGKTSIYTDDGFPYGFPLTFSFAEKNQYYSNIFNRLP